MKSNQKSQKINMFKKEYLGRSIVSLVGMIMILLTMSIGIFLFVKGFGSFTTYKHSIIEFLFTGDWKPKDDFTGGGQIGAGIFIVGSISTCLLSLIIAVPFSLASAIFMVEISPKLGEKFLQPAIELFVGIPSVVYGWIGLTVLVPALKNIFKVSPGESVLAAAIVLAVMIYPTITSLSVDAIRSVPGSYRNAAYGLGATRWQMIKHTTIPAAKTGIYTGIVMGLARAFGEALAVAMVIGKMKAFPKFEAPYYFFMSPTHNLTSAIAADMGGAADGGEMNIALWSMALLLFLISLFFIILIHYISARGKKQNEK